MKIEVDLNDILGEEGETLEESIRRQVIERLTENIKRGVSQQIEAQTSALINAEIRDSLKEKIPGILEDLLNSEYVPVDQYGQKSAPTSFRASLIKAVADECTFQPTRSTYDQNQFTKTLKSMIEAQFSAFKKEFDKTVNEQFRKDAITYAITELHKRLGLPAKPA